MPVSIFISYSSEDFKLAKNIESIIQGMDLDCFLDKREMRLGALVTHTISNALKNHDYLLAIISPDALDSNWVLFEIGYAMGIGKKILPYVTSKALRKNLPGYLHDRHCSINLDELREQLQKLTGHISTYKEQNITDKPYSPPSIIKTLQRSRLFDLRVPNSEEVFSSFEPSSNDLKLLQICIRTTDGWIFDETTKKYERDNNHVYIVRDPIRPFEIQIGRRRANRPSAKPGSIVLTGSPSLEMVTELYPNGNAVKDKKWLRMVFAEIVDSPETLEFIYEREQDDKDIRRIVARNPFTPNNIRSKECLFCQNSFYSNTERVLMKNDKAKLIANDFPFGPYFHCIVIPNAEVHSWDKIDIDDLLAVNKLAKAFLESPAGERLVNESAGIRFGLNSSVRHIVMGKKTTTSAGASIDHVHKQLWGMSGTSYNLANHLCQICDIYEKNNIDYLVRYLHTLREANFIIWENDKVALYVPFGQTSVHELQIMVKRSGVHTLLDLDEIELASLTIAEFYVIQIYRELKINSFNEVLLSRSFDSTIGNRFRLILTFVTREVDLAVSELSLAYVVDKHPEDTLKSVYKVWPKIESRYSDLAP